MPSNTIRELYPIVIFLPSDKCSENSIICGEVTVNIKLKTKNFFVHSYEEYVKSAPVDTIGTVGSSRYRQNKSDWLRLKICDCIPIVDEVISDGRIITTKDYQVIIYDKLKFMRSQLLFPAEMDYTNKPSSDWEEIDHFKCLTSFLHLNQSVAKAGILQPLKTLICLRFMIFMKILESIMRKFLFILKFSTLAIHMSSFLHNAIWCLESVLKSKGNITLKSGNYIFALITDWLGGMLLIYWFINLMHFDDILQLLTSQSEIIVLALKDMVYYLMGSPADLKLNGPLNNVLGKFFLFHIDLWWAFLGYSRPMLELGFKMFICLGSLGLSFQIAILADLLAVASFHVYIIYVYAARLYNAQVMGLGSLSRVFIGRKRNPVPGRVDSCPYSTEQLLIGTISFTVLLFLLPTTLVYYIVFTAIRLVLIAVGGVLTQARFLLSAMPLYSSLLWLINSPLTTSSVKLTPTALSPEHFLLLASPVQGAWWPTVKSTVPEVITRPLPVHWPNLFWDLLVGRLIYPV